MATKIYQSKPIPGPVSCDFGWYYGSVGSPQRLSEATYQVNGVTYPPGFSVTAGSVTLPTASNITLASTTSFESSGTIEFYSGLSPSQRTTSPYTVVSGTQINCTGGSGTFANGTPVFDPRMYVDQLPLQQTVIFDAVDHDSLGLPITQSPSGISILSYRWDFGNGQTAYGPYASTTFSYSSPIGSLMVSLSVIDSLGRQYSCAHHVLLGAQSVLHGVSLKEVQSAAHYR